MPRSESVKKYWDSEKSRDHRAKLSKRMRAFWAKVKRWVGLIIMPYKDPKEQRLYNQKYRQSHKEENKKYQRQYRQSHKETQQRYNKKYQQTHKEGVRQYNKEYRGLHKEKQRQYHKEYQRKYRQSPNGKERNRANKKRYRQTPRGRATRITYRRRPGVREAERLHEKKYHQSPEGRLSTRQHNARHRKMGFKLLCPNIWPCPVDYHHIAPGQPYVVPIPRELHQSFLGKRHHVVIASFIPMLFGLNLETSPPVVPFWRKNERIT